MNPEGPSRRDVLRAMRGLLTAPVVAAIATAASHEKVYAYEVPREYSFVQGSRLLWEKSLEDGREYGGVYVTFKDPARRGIWMPTTSATQGTHHLEISPVWDGIEPDEVATVVHVHTHPYESREGERRSYSRPPSLGDIGRGEFHPSTADFASIRLSFPRTAGAELLGSVRVASGAYFFAQESIDNLQRLLPSLGRLDRTFMDRLPAYERVYSDYRRLLVRALESNDERDAYVSIMRILAEDAEKIRASPDGPQGGVWPEYAQIGDLLLRDGSRRALEDAKSAVHEGLLQAYHSHDAVRTVLETLAGGTPGLRAEFDAYIRISEEMLPLYNPAIIAEGKYAEALEASGLTEAAFISTPDGARLFAAFQKAYAELGALVYFRSDAELELKRLSFR